MWSSWFLPTGTLGAAPSLCPFCCCTELLLEPSEPYWGLNSPVSLPLWSVHDGAACAIIESLNSDHATPVHAGNEPVRNAYLEGTSGHLRF